MRLWLSRRIHSPNPIIVAPEICRQTKRKRQGAEEERGKKKEGRINHVQQDRGERGAPHFSLQAATCSLQISWTELKMERLVFMCSLKDRKVVCVCEYVTNTLILTRRKLRTVAWSLTVGIQFCFALSSHLGLIGPCSLRGSGRRGGGAQRMFHEFKNTTAFPKPTRTSTPSPLLMSNTMAHAGVCGLRGACWSTKCAHPMCSQ